MILFKKNIMLISIITGMKSIMLAAGNLAVGRSKVAIAGGFESMSNVPFYMKRGDTPYGNYNAYKF